MSDPQLGPVEGNECETVAEKKPQISLDDPLVWSIDKEVQTVTDRKCQPDLDDPLLGPVEEKVCETMAEKKPQISLDDLLIRAIDKKAQAVTDRERQPDLDDPLLQLFDEMECHPGLNEECQAVTENERQPNMMVKEEEQEEIFTFSSPTSEPDGKLLELPPESSPRAAEAEIIESYTLDEANPYFHIIIARSHVIQRYYVILQNKITSKLPSAKVPVVLKCRGKCWNMSYLGDQVCKVFDHGWKQFAADNELKVGDCCFFELTESSAMRIVFKVIILRCKLSDCGETDGDTPETAITID